MTDDEARALGERAVSAPHTALSEPTRWPGVFRHEGINDPGDGPTVTLAYEPGDLDLRTVSRPGARRPLRERLRERRLAELALRREAARVHDAWMTALAEATGGTLEPAHPFRVLFSVTEPAEDDEP